MTRLAAGLVGSLALLAVLDGSLLRERARARAEAARATAEARAPRLVAPDGRGLSGDAALFRLVADRAAAAGVRLSLRPVADPPAPGLLALDLDGAGMEGAVRGFAQGLESGPVLVRLVRWSIADAGGGLRLRARAVAPLAGSGDGEPIALAPIPVGPLGAAALFASDAPADAVPAQRPGTPPQLIGLVGPAVRPLAMVRGTDGTVRTLAIGESAEGWTLAAAAADRATFRRGREERVAVLPARDEAEAPPP